MGDPASKPTKAVAPVLSPAGKSAGEKIVVSRKDCPEPARTADEFKAASVRSSWKLLSVTDEEQDAVFSYYGFFGGAMASDGALWALYDAGEHAGTPVRWKDGRWERVAMPPGVKTVKALATGPDGKIWAVEPKEGTWKGGVREGDGWQELTLTVPGGGKEDRPVTAHDGWVSSGATAVRWDGTSWERLDLPPGIRYGGMIAEYRLFGPREETWAVPEDESKVVRVRNGVSQMVEFGLEIDAKEAAHGGGGFDPQAVVVLGKDETWVLGAATFGAHYVDVDEDTDAGRMVALRYAQGKWTCMWGPFHRENFNDNFVEAVPDGNGGFWAVTSRYLGTDSTLWHFSSGRWTRERLPADEGAEQNVTDLVANGHEIYALGSIFSRGSFRGALWRVS
ncbi:hypothetical protein Misp02_68480 [Microtetraspora sp. NBRC 16547]|nr:hypothetical protein Misp02_68480 [Microtetraspora sp. NBRC 16547]